MFIFGGPINDFESVKGGIDHIDDQSVKVVLLEPKRYAHSWLVEKYPIKGLCLQEQMGIAHYALVKLYRLCKQGTGETELYCARCDENIPLVYPTNFWF